LEEAASIYYDEQGMRTHTMKYQRGHPLVSDDEYEKLTTHMLRLYEYYMTQATKTTNFGFEVITRNPLVFHYAEEEKFDVEWECLFQLYQKHSLDSQILTLWTM
jgi:hypothetical protein